jgi:hypothetical protein
MASTEEDLRALAVKRIKDKQDFLSHVATYAVVNAGLIAVWAMTGAGYRWFLWPLLGWGVGLALHGINLWRGLAASSASGLERQSRAVDREVERMRRSRGLPPEPREA